MGLGNITGDRLMKELSKFKKDVITDVRKELSSLKRDGRDRNELSDNEDNTSRGFDPNGW